MRSDKRDNLSFIRPVIDPTMKIISLVRSDHNNMLKKTVSNKTKIDSRSPSRRGRTKIPAEINRSKNR